MGHSHFDSLTQLTGVGDIATKNIGMVPRTTVPVLLPSAPNLRPTLVAKAKMMMLARWKRLRSRPFWRMLRRGRRAEEMKDMRCKRGEVWGEAHRAFGA